MFKEGPVGVVEDVVDSVQGPINTTRITTSNPIMAIGAQGVFCICLSVSSIVFQPFRNFIPNLFKIAVILFEVLTMKVYLDIVVAYRRNQAVLLHYVEVVTYSPVVNPE